MASIFRSKRVKLFFSAKVLPLLVSRVIRDF